MPHRFGTLLQVTGQSGAVDPGWFVVDAGHRAQLAFQFSLTAGTATFVLEGRNTESDAAIQLATGSAAAKALVEAFAQMRCRLSAAAGASCAASVPALVRSV